MRNLQLGKHDLIMSPKLKIGHCDPIKVKLDSSKVPYTCYPQGGTLLTLCQKLFELGHIGLIN